MIKKKKFKTKPKQNKCCQPLSSTLANVTTGGGGAHRARSSRQLTLRTNARGVGDAEALPAASEEEEGGRKARRGGLLRPCRRQRQWEGALLTSDTGARALGS